MARKRKHQCVNIDNYCGTTDLFEGLVRPSLERNIRKVLYRNGIWTISDLCLYDMEKFRGLPFMTDEMVDTINERLQECGLHLGMTNQEMDDYVDEEYFRDHPDEYDAIREERELRRQAEQKDTDDDAKITSNTVSEGIKPHFEEQELVPLRDKEKQVEKEADEELGFVIKPQIPKPVVPFSEAQERFFKMEQAAYAEEWDEEMEEKYKERIDSVCHHSDYTDMRDSDKEFLRQRYFGIAYNSQPWFVKWFRPFRERVLKAFEESYIMYESHVNMAVARSLKSEKEEYNRKRKELFGI